ncbi:unnamed protein product, partial [Timema podura]|nr:unnamed protein product [Timema podura]
MVVFASSLCLAKLDVPGNAPLANYPHSAHAMMLSAHSGLLLFRLKEANGELSWDEQDVSQRPWTFNEFVSQFSELYSWLNNIQEAVYGKEENVTDRNLRLCEK